MADLRLVAVFGDDLTALKGDEGAYVGLGLGNVNHLLAKSGGEIVGFHIRQGEVKKVPVGVGSRSDDEQGEGDCEVVTEDHVINSTTRESIFPGMDY
mmetsp:Transcript_35518/g.77771  ORF Transcript_35518/g.77771 Transcript_35518/m.77771 type:complete len:97 (+) Transcript_35518:465-755(+)